MDDQRFEAGDPPPRDFLPPWKLFRVPKGGYVIDPIIVSTRVVGVRTHFDGQRRVLCRQGFCPPSIHTKPSRWYGYCQAMVPKVQVLALLEVTEDCFRQMKENAGDSDQGFRGMLFRMKRRGEKPNAPVSVEVLNMLRGIEPLPDEVDVWPMILKLYRVT